MRVSRWFATASLAGITLSPWAFTSTLFAQQLPVTAPVVSEATEFTPFAPNIPNAESPASPSDIRPPIVVVDAPCPPAPPAGAAELKKKQADLKKAVAGAYAPLFYNNNFNYLCNPLYDDCHFGEAWKRNGLGDCWVYDLGGQYRARYHGERNMRGLGLTGRDDDFLLHRTRLFANLERGDSVRVFAEFIDAESNYENFAPRGIEVNRSDFLNLFGDLKVFDGCCGDLKLRVGRQELLYGSERLVSPLDWANTRRTFEGAKLLWVGQDWNIDAFYTRPVIVDPHNFDSADYNQEFMGGWATYKGIKNQTIDLYALQYNNARLPNDFNFTTLGSRWTGSDGALVWDFEGGMQFGTNNDGSDHSAAFATAGVGHKFEDHCWKPTLWGFYDWASGGNVDNANATTQGKGFNHLLPLAHKYLGFMDLFGRSNIQSPNLLLQAQPREKLKTLLWYYYFFLDSADDVPYNVNMTPFNFANRPASRDLGHEIDLIAIYSINARMELLFGYSHFFAGDYYKTTPGLTYRGDADFFYTQFQWNF